MKKTGHSEILKNAGAFVACAIGSGFATGQEILQFFAFQGPMSILGAILSGLIFSWMGDAFMTDGYSHGIDCPKAVLSFYFGEKIGKAVYMIIQLALFGVYCIMISGAGEAIRELCGIPAMWGRIIMAGLVLITVLPGLSRLTDILGWIGPVIIVFSLFIGAASSFGAEGTLDSAAEYIETHETVRAGGGWLWAAILYPGFNAVVLSFFSCAVGSGAGSRKKAALAGVLGGAMLGLAILVMNTGLLLNINEVGASAVPTLILAGKYGKAFSALYSVMICLGIYTTAAPVLWGCVRQLAEDGTVKAAALALVFSLCGLVLAMTDFRTLVNKVYSLSGYVGIVLLICVLLRKLKIIDYNSNNDRF